MYDTITPHDQSDHVLIFKSELSEKNERRITNHPTFEAHLLGLLGKTVFHVFSY